MRKWLSGRASPCQGEGREFESRLPLQTTTDVHTSVLLYIFLERLAQLDRASGYGPEGRGFESSIVRQAKWIMVFDLRRL